MSDAKVVIAGTGRAGTTLLVALLSDLGIDTGFRPGVKMDGSGGLERDPSKGGNMPRVIKAPGLSTRLGRLLDENIIEVEHVIVPTRDLDIAAASRIRVAGYGRFLGVRGGFTGTRSARRQKRVLESMLSELVWTIARYDLPHTFLEFPRFAHDWHYLYEKLGFLDPTLTVDDVRVAVEKRYDANAIREEPLSRRERFEAWLIAPWTFVRRVAKRLGWGGTP